MVSTRKRKETLFSRINSHDTEGVVPMIDAQVAGQNVSKVYIDGGAQICVISEKVMHCLGLEVNEPSDFKAKLANNVTVK